MSCLFKASSTKSLQLARSLIVRICSVAPIPYHVDRLSFIFIRRRLRDLFPFFLLVTRCSKSVFLMMCPINRICLIVVIIFLSFVLAVLKILTLCFSFSSTKVSSFFLKFTFQLLRWCVRCVYLMSMIHNHYFNIRCFFIDTK